MTARSDLDNAFSILDAGITAHVAALKTSKVATAAAQALAADESYLQDITTKVLAFADTLASSNPSAPIAPDRPYLGYTWELPVAPAPVALSEAPASLAIAGNAPAVLRPAAQQIAQVTQVLPAHLAPHAAPAKASSVFSDIEASLSAMLKNSPK